MRIARTYRIAGVAALALLLAGALCSLLVTQSRVRAEVAPENYVGDQACKVCHNNAEDDHRWDTWWISPHSKAYRTLLSEESTRIALERGMKTMPVESPECLRCHVTGYDAVAASAPEAVTLGMGVQCESCHGPGAQHIADAQRLLTGKEDGVNMAAHILYPEEPECLACHNEESPTWDTTRFKLEDGGTSPFDYRQAVRRAVHPSPKDLEADAP